MKLNQVSSQTILGFFLGLSLLILSSGCGKQVSVAETDDLVSDSPIAYSAGWASAPTIYLSVQIPEENSSDVQNYGFSGTLIQKIQNAAATWNTAADLNNTQRKIINVDTSSYLTTTGNTLAGCSSYSGLYSPLCYNKNGIYYDRKSGTTGGWANNTGKSQGVLATAVWTTSGGHISKASIRFNRDYYIFGDTTTDYNVSEDNYNKTIVDMESVVLHEMGHMLGLGHAKEESTSVMYPSMNIGRNSAGFSTVKRNLSYNDCIRINTIYNPSVASPSKCSSYSP